MHTNLDGSTHPSPALRPSIRVRSIDLVSTLLLTSAALACALTLAYRGRQYWVFTLDDAFITLRYARHLAEGAGPAWNVGGAPAEGYTTALWLIWLALAELLGVGLLVAKLSGAAFTFAAIALAARMCFELTPQLDSSPRKLTAAVPFLVACAYWPLALHGISGMETGLSLLLVTLLCFTSMRVLAEPSTHRYRLFALVQLLAVLARPEACVACAAASVACFVQLPRSQRTPLVRMLAWFLVLPGSLYFALRYAYFGLAFPLSFYVKAKGQAPLAGLPDVLAFFRPLLLEAPWWLIAACAGVVASRRLVPSLAALLALIVFFIFPAHIMAFEGRYLLPIFPLLTVLMGVGVGTLIQHASKLMPGSAWLVTGTVVAAACIPFPGRPQERAAQWTAYGVNLTRAHVGLARDLTQAAARGPHSIALLDVGAVGYYANWFTIDTFGLNDARVAISQRTDIDYVFQHQPELLVLVSKLPGRFSPVFDWEQPLHERAQRLGYRYMCDYQFEPDYYLHLLSAPDSKLSLCQSAFTTR